MAEIDPLLARQLRRLGLEDLGEPPDKETWHKVVARISEHYRHVADDRSLLTRSLDLSTNEMGALHRQLLAERDRLRSVVVAIGDALTIFHDAASSQVEPSRPIEVGSTISTAKRRFASKLGELFSLSGAAQAAPGSATQDAAGASGSDEAINEVRVQLVALGDRLVQLLYDTAEKASLKKQLEVARAVQQMLVPSEDVIERPSLRLASHFQPAAECGGDWWTFHDLPDGRLLTVVGDVTGHGISSAIITGAAKAACDVVRTFAREQLSPAQLLRVMNCSIFEAGQQKFLMTCAACIFDPAAGSLTLANAGHPFPYLVRNSAIRQLAAQGEPLGAASSAEYTSSTIALEGGDALLWFTDGVTECENESSEQFTEKRLRSLFQSVAAGAPEEARDAIVEAVSRFRGERALDDDVTLVVARVS
ncbi:PP2C family protein-serine/threonine phosphatase [Sorangium atrum]|uniref:PP2C family protein-serine/threonine phosphatase n=1 Tax=Sorangium atrum TaxID=2995308 RepID=A0ABT5BYK3_9BACT|nr:PP2C family protein-serine/threonine phosphatase [Sorangium aterium]MDC0679167.1 PP2C family protein-serine/threonine phosphatase [Sorangium aterium]